MIQAKFYQCLLLITAALLAVCLLAGATLLILSLTDPGRQPADQPPPAETPDAPGDDPNKDSGDDPSVSAPVEPADRILGATEDMGQGYIDSMIFVGESTTAHLRDRGGLTGGKATEQVWSNLDNTMTLDMNITQKTIVYPPTGQSMTIPAAAAVARPEYIVLSFGVNGIQGFAKNENLYTTAYAKLIDAIHAYSPETVVLIQTVYPLAANQTTFGEGAATINGYIDRLNALLPALAAEHDAYVVDTASVLVGSDGMLRPEYQNGDGLHLTESAYLQILQYLRTHGAPR